MEKFVSALLVPRGSLEKTQLSLMIIVFLSLPCTTPTARRERGRREITVLFIVIIVVTIIITMEIINAWTSYITCLTC